jgi:hypothetical protein
LYGAERDGAVGVERRVKRAGVEPVEEGLENLGVVLVERDCFGGAAGLPFGLQRSVEVGRVVAQEAFVEMESAKVLAGSDGH